MYYVLIYILIGGYFLINLFVGVIFVEFNKAQDNESGHNKFETEEQIQWVEF